MNYGHVVNADNPSNQIGVQDPNWVPIINPDIKLGSEVLGDARKNYATYKTVKMIDFGHASRYEEITDKIKMMGTRDIRPPVSATVALAYMF